GLALCHFEIGNERRAKQHGLLYVAAVPDDSDVLFLCFVCGIETGDERVVREMGAQLLQIDPSDVEVRELMDAFFEARK
ncbi:MAG: hypothetical protein ACRC5C_01130, partial [Bacilli bacterium]